MRLSPIGQDACTVKINVPRVGLIIASAIISNFCVLLPSLAAPSLRPPAVPLVAHDPYFSIWSPADKLTEADTVHWTGKPHRITSLVRIDGRGFRLVGKEPAAVPPLPQTGLRVTPTRSICTFEGAGVRLTLTFMTPALPENLEVLSRPVTYLTWQFQALDGRTHEAAVYFEASPEIAINDPAEQLETILPSVPGLAVLGAGSVQQPVLQQKGDDVRIDWGHFYMAAPGAYQERGHDGPSQLVWLQADRGTSREAWAKHGALSSIAVPNKFLLKEATAQTLGFTRELGSVASAPVSCWIMLAYDDEFSIKYFGQKLRPYWRRNGDDAAVLLRKAAADYHSLVKRCADFDESLTTDLTKLGGEKYAALCALAYRQTLAGNKIVADPGGKPLMFPKENFSNGCIGTVDVLFPQSPFFLSLSPALTKAMLVPILDYAASARWKFAYAPHDLGTYPHATGQVYGGGEQTDQNQIPVEESGNMLIMLAALARSEGNTDFASKYWPLLRKWADYCVQEGLDPVNQLCSADMFGHLPRCANLALKAIIGIGGFGQLCEAAGRKEEARRYFATARDYAHKWQELAKDDGHTRLAYHLPGTWGMKHNLIWDRVLGLDLFPKELANAEITWYRKVQKEYGLPVDSRTDTSLIDWAVWSIAPAANPAEFESLLDPLFRYVNETPSRVPLSDWFFTTDGRQKGFQARPVVGGLFIKMIADQGTWTKWAKRGADVSGPWAPILVSARPAEIVPTGRKQAVNWRFTLEQPADDWFQARFDDTSWSNGPAAFGTKGTPGAPIRTEWNTKQIWLRREFVLPERRLKNPRLLAIYDEDPDFYLNGVLAAKMTSWITSYDEVEISPNALGTLKPGTNVLAVHARQTWGGQAIDAGLVEDSPWAGLLQLMDTPLRDPSICRGPDGTWYLTGTVEPFWGYNEGIKIWKSRTLESKTWEPLGMVWHYGQSPWHRKYFEAKKPLWAPEIHFLKNTFWLTYSIPGWDGTGKTSGSGLLRSTTGKPEGPYEDVQPAERLGDEIDASLFQDDDGSVYFLWHSGKLARMKPDMSGLAEPYHWLRTTTTDPAPNHHSPLCQGIFGPDSYDHVGYEGMFLFKNQGRYYLCCSENFDGRYSCAVATSTNIYGPYGSRYEAVPHAGHNMLFQDERGGWWSTLFGSDPQAPLQERAGILPVYFDKTGRLALEP